MLRFLTAIVFAWPLVGVVGGSAFAAEDPSPLVEPERRERGVFVPTKAEKLDALFETLGDADDPDSAREAERAILNLWMESGSDTVDLLMTWSLAAMQADFHARALDFLDRVVLMQPDYAEGWNKRATVYFLMEDYGRSIADIGQVLEIEPRHFGALSGLGMILRALGEEERAITAFRSALAVNPHLEDVRDALDELETAKVGQSL
ncbi:MAG: hypothetical protein GY798_00590 [Hyphomicrobiales bacterium]|nr:hypothetical protein [Hyphomicrobiales bacterium]